MSLSVNFNGKYTINANQQLKSKKENAQRDYLLGFFAKHSSNSSEIANNFINFDKKVKQGLIQPNSPCYLTLDLKDEKVSAAFEDSMTKIGQNFTKIG